MARNADGGITGAVFAVDNKRIVDHVRQLDLTTGNYGYYYLVTVVTIFS